MGKLYVSYPDDDIVELRTAFQRKFRLVFAATEGPLRPTLKCDGQPAEDGAVKLEDGTITFTAQAGRTYSVHLHQVTK